MSDPEPLPSERPGRTAARQGSNSPVGGISLRLVYSLVGLAMAAAIAIAVAIVLPFYQRR